MNNIISEYQKWKQQGEDLRVQAKEAMEARFRELLLEAVRIAEEYRSDFSVALKPPPAVTAFRYKATAKAKAKKHVKAKVAAKPERAAPKVEAPPAKPDKKMLGLQKRLATAKKKLDEAKAAGAPTKNLEDRIYELEDEFRLAGEAR